MNDENYIGEHSDDLPEPIENQSPPALLFSNRTYDILKPTTSYILPGVITLWLTLAAVWDWPNVQEVAATIGALNVFLGIGLNLSARSYNKSDAKFDGVVQFQDDPDAQVVNVGYALTAPDPRELANKNEVVLKVIQPDKP